MTLGIGDVRVWVLAVVVVCTAACNEQGTTGTTNSSAQNRAPTLSGTPRLSVAAGTPYLFAPVANDPENDPLVFGVDGKPSWASIDPATGRLTGTPSVADLGTYRGVVVWVSDGQHDTALPAFDIRVLAPSSSPGGPNRAPVISGVAPSEVVAGTEYNFTPVASDADGDQLSFSIRNRPPWATFSVDTGSLRGTPQVANAGKYSDISIAVTDGQSTVETSPFAITVTVSNVNAAPQISGSPPTSVEGGSSYSFVPTASDANGDILTFSVSGLPSWASFDPTTGELAGIAPSQAGTYSNIVISVTDGAASASLPPFTIDVTAAAGNAAPTISGSPPTTATVGVAYEFQPTADDADGDPLTFAIANRPSWAAFDTGTGRLSGTPTAGDLASFGGIVISVSDGRATAALPAFGIQVNPAPNNPPTIAGTPDPQVLVDSSYSFQPTASDADGDTLSFSIVNKPAWATFSSTTGRLTGTPTAADVGTTSGIVISVTDGLASDSLPAFSVEVVATATGSATLSWLAPTENTDGSPLLDLAGYKIYWGPSEGAYPNSHVLSTAGVTTYVVEGLVPGQYFFAMTAINSAGVESAYSQAVSFTVQ